jgi:hypothetical protein
MLAVLGGVVVIAGLFLHWFGPLTAWQAFEVADVLLAALAVATVLTALDTRSTGRPLPWIGAALIAVVASQLVELPPAVDEGASLGVGAWLALAGAALVLAGGVLRVAELSMTVTVAARDARGRVPAVDRRQDLAAAPGDPDPTESFPAATEP